MRYWSRIVSLLAFDAILINMSVYFALWLRFEGKIPANYMNSFIDLIPWLTLMVLGCLYFFRLYHRMWQYASTGELYVIIKSVSISILLLIALIYTVPLPYLPRSIYILSWLLMMMLIGGSRLGWRVIRENIIKEVSTNAKKALIIGAGDAGAMVARELMNNKSLGLSPVGFVDDSDLKQKLSLFGIPVLGERQDIPQIIENYGIEEIILAMPSASGKSIREFRDICHATPAKLRIFQGTDDLLNGEQKIRNIELEDLLRREPVKLDLAEISSYITNHSVMVSGAGGSIGSELCRQVCKYQPQTIVLLECSENNLFDIENELRELFPDIVVEAELCDIKNRARLETVFQKHLPQVIFHAAAFKHVPMMELHPEEALYNNVLGTRNMAEFADSYGTTTFVLISTDKAVNPTNIMGASKRLAELVVKDINRSSLTHFAAVRFGNVLGSRGSVVPTFLKQIEKGGPITVTHPDMTRYFMTIPEAVELVIQAGAIAKGGEIFVLDMGEPVKIIDLAGDIIRLSGHEPGHDIKISFTGIRPGEKLYEELFSGREEVAATRHERIYISTKELDERYRNIYRNIETWIKSLSPERGEIIKLIKTLLPEYQRTEPSEKIPPNGDIINFEERSNKIKKTSGIK